MHADATDPDLLRVSDSALWRLSSIEAWERFSYYTLMVLLPLFLSAPVASGGLGWETKAALGFYGAYVAAITIMPLFGGWVSDRWLGTERALINGALLMLAGHAAMGLSAVAAQGDTVIFFGALAIVALGNGLFKPNISVLIGRLPHADEGAHDAAYGTFWVYINIGGMAAGFISGWLAQRFGYHLAFGAAGVGMAVAIGLLLAFRTRFIRPYSLNRPDASRIEQPMAVDWRFLTPLGAVLAFAILFGIGYFQTAGAVSLFTEHSVQRQFGDFTIPTPWFVALNPLFGVLLMPSLFRAWRHGKGFAHAWPASRKMAFGFLLLAGAFALVLGAVLESSETHRANPVWIVAAIFVLTCAELFVGPIALAAVSRLAPASVANLAMGSFSAAIGIGALLSGQVGAAAMSYGYTPVFVGVTFGALICAGLLMLLGRWFGRRRV